MFKRKVIYLGHIISIDDEGLVRIQAMGDKCAAIRDMNPPKTRTQVRRFVGAVNYLSMYLPKLQEILRPLHTLTRKNTPFNWKTEHQNAFEQIKEMLVSPPVLHAPRSRGRFVLYSDTSRYGTGSHLMQIIDGKERLVAYYSKRLPKSALNFSVTELELYGMWINITAYHNILCDQDFDVFVDHSALVQIVKSKTPPSTPRLQKLLESLSPYSFKLGYRKGSSMELSDFLSRNPRDDDSEFDRITPITLLHDLVTMQATDDVEIVFPVVTRGYAKRMGITVPPISANTSNKQSVNPNPAPRRTTNSPAAQRRTRQRPRSPIPAPEFQPADDEPSHSPPTRPLVRRRTNPSNEGPPTMEPRLIDKTKPSQEEVVPPPEPVIVEEHRKPTSDQTTPSSPIITNVDKVLSKHIPKQFELNRIMNIIKKKVIRDYNLPIALNTLRMAQQSSAEFKSVYDYIAHNILPNDKRAQKSIILRSEQFILVNDVLFRLFFHSNDEQFSFQLAVPEPYIDTIISRYHDGLLSSHSGVVRTYLTLRKKFYFRNMFERIAGYIKGCTRCQQIKGKTDNLRPFHPRIPDDYCPFQDISMDFKSMPRSPSGYRHIMVVCCNITRYLVCVPLKDLEAETVCEAFLQRVVTNYGIPSRVVTDLAATFTGKLFYGQNI